MSLHFQQLQKSQHLPAKIYFSFSSSGKLKAKNGTILD